MTDQEDERCRPHPNEVHPALEAAPLLEPPIPNDPAVFALPTLAFNEAHFDFASFQEGYIRHYIALADTKAGVIFAFAAGIIGYLLNDADIRNVILAPSCSLHFFIPVFALASLGIVSALAFLVIAPRLAASSGEGLVFFDAVASRTTGAKYAKEIAATSEQEIIEARVRHCYDVARVCSSKYKLLKVAIWLTPLSLFLALFATFSK